MFWEAAQRAFKKIRATLGKEALKYVDRFAAVFHQTTVGASDYSQKAELLDTLMQGIEDRRAMFITYRSLRATESVTYDIYPYGLTYHRGSLYLIGHAPQHDDIRHWKVDRIEDARLEELRFNRPDDFDLREHFAKSFGVFHGAGEVHVKVRFSPKVARYVEESQWHASQKLTKEKDGSLLAAFDLDGTEEIMRWILSFGQHAEPAFQKLIENIQREQKEGERTGTLPWPKLRVMQLTATNRNDNNCDENDGRELCGLTDAEKNPPDKIPEARGMIA